MGYILPVLYLIGTFGILAPGIPPLDHLIKSAASAESITEVLWWVLGLWLLAVVLSTLNTPIIKLLEGYYLPSIIANRWKGKQRTQYSAMINEYEQLKKSAWAKNNNLSSTSDIQQDSMHSTNLRNVEEEIKILKERAQTILIKRRENFPVDPARIMPTRLGNVIRAFETYPNEIYGADGVALWPHVHATLTSDQQRGVADAKSLTDLFVNVTILSIIIAFTAIVQFIFFVGERLVHCTRIPCPTEESWGLMPIFIVFIGSVAAAYLSYQLSVWMARSWGQVVKALFDLQLGVVATKLGLDVPAQEEKRRTMWIALSQQVVYSSVSNLDEFRRKGKGLEAERDKS